MDEGRSPETEAVGDRRTAEGAMITTKREDLRDALQTAIEIEHSTIPPYLCALYSIAFERSPDAARAITGVVMEEMLHLTLAANVMNAIGYTPSIGHAGFVPSYPTRLPYCTRHFEISLGRFSKQALDTFLRIERPERLPERTTAAAAAAEVEPYATIGEFYRDLERQLVESCAVHGEKHVFCGDPARQIRPEHYYGGGDIVVVTDLASALAALSEIIHQGEGVDGTIYDGDEPLGAEGRELAHFFRFEEIRLGRRFTRRDTPRTGPTGAPIAVDWDAVYPMRPNPKVRDYAGRPDVQERLRAFNRSYSDLLRTLGRAFAGEQELLVKSVGGMYDLRNAAVALMRIPSGDGDTTVGPSFEWTPPA
jgi:hypothetical protein